MTVWMLLLSFDLCHLVYGFAQMGHLSGGIVLVINALGSSHLDGLGRCLQLGFCSGLVPCLDSGVHLLHSSLGAGLDRLVSLSLGAVYQNSLLRGFNICQNYTSNYDPNMLLSTGLS